MATKISNANSKLSLVLFQSLREWQFQWDRSIQTNFRVGGRPAWKKTRRGGAILQDRGRLARSITIVTRKVNDDRFEVVAQTNNIRYAKIHQYGGKILPKNSTTLSIPLTPEASKLRSPRDWPNDELFFFKSKEGKAFLGVKDPVTGEVKPQFILLKSVYIPARPYLVVQREDREVLESIIRDNLKLLKGS